MSDMQMEAFDEYYVRNHLTEQSPIGSRDYVKVKEGWQAAIRHLTEQNEQRDSHE